MVRRGALALAWLGAALLVALGAAGLVAALDHPAGGPGRPELTWTADRAAATALDASAEDLAALTEAVGVLGDHGRAALSALVARDEAALAAAIPAGSAQLDVIDEAAATLERGLVALELDAPDRAIRYSPATLARYDALAGAVAAVEPLRPAWERLAAGVAPAVGLTRHLLAHDEIAGRAIQLGGAGRYADAIERIDEATAELDAARVVRDQLAANVDVTTLDQWLDRNASYGAALRDLWDALRTSKGRATAAVRDAAAREQEARALLPPDARALVVILGDVARGGLNQAVIAIEEVRGQLLDAATAAADATRSAAPEAAPTATPSPEAAPTATPPRAPASPTTVPPTRAP